MAVDDERRGSFRPRAPRVEFIELYEQSDDRRGRRHGLRGLGPILNCETLSTLVEQNQYRWENNLGGKKKGKLHVKRVVTLNNISL